MEWGKARRGGKNAYGYRLDLNLPSSHLSLTCYSCCAFPGVRGGDCRCRWVLELKLGLREYTVLQGAPLDHQTTPNERCPPSLFFLADASGSSRASRAKSARSFASSRSAPVSPFFFLPQRSSRPCRDALPPSLPPSLLFLPACSSTTFPPSPHFTLLSF